MQLIGLAGGPGVGKTTLSLMLLDAFPGYHRTAFGDLIKQEVGARFHIRTESFYQPQDELIEMNELREKAGMPEAMPVSRLLEWYGQRVMTRNKNHWVMVMEKWLKLCDERRILGMIIDDVQSPHEANLVKRRRGLLVRIDPYPGLAPEGEEQAYAGALAGYRGFDAVFSPAYGEGELAKVAQAIRLHGR